jgi:formylglycine-generating enzyme required for sulfatase activity
MPDATSQITPSPDWTSRLPAPFPPPWAEAYGDDEYGVWAQFKVKDMVQRVRWIEAGQFWMGSAEDEHGRRANEGPRHLVTISHGFWLADTACSQALWQAVMGENPSRFHAEKRGGPNHPVESISWIEIQQFLRKLSAMLSPETDFMASLPTEAEWEYACRAGTKTPFWFGEDIHTDQANFNGNHPYRGGKQGEYRKKTVPVDAFAPNGWGLYQMHGNVLEWCGDPWREYESAAVLDPGLSDVLLPQGDQESRPGRAIRGGGWGSTARRARSGYRDHYWQGGRDDYLGFRLAPRSRQFSPGA